MFLDTWLDDDILPSLYNLSNYKSILQVGNYSKGGGVSIYTNKSLKFKLRLELSINSQDTE